MVSYPYPYPYPYAYAYAYPYPYLRARHRADGALVGARPVAGVARRVARHACNQRVGG